MLTRSAHIFLGACLADFLLSDSLHFDDILD